MVMLEVPLFVHAKMWQRGQKCVFLVGFASFLRQYRLTWPLFNFKTVLVSLASFQGNTGEKLQQHWKRFGNARVNFKKVKLIICSASFHDPSQ